MTAPTNPPHASHSPTPFPLKISELQEQLYSNRRGTVIVTDHMNDGTPYYTEAFVGEIQGKEDAAFIVRAVNAYDGHVELLERSIATMENIMLHLGKDMTEGDQHGRWKFVEEMKSALAKASRGNL